MLTKTAIHLDSGFFAQFLGQPAKPIGNMSLMDELSNPLLDKPYFSYSTSIDSNTGNAKASLETVLGGVSGVNPLPIQCKNHMSEVTFGPQGVSIGSIHF